jgi:Uncharacterised protein family (UPF0175)
MDVQIQIPDDVARVIQNQQPDLSRAALEALALEGYRSERLSEGQVRRMLGFRTRMQVHSFLKLTTSTSITPSANLRMT